jgi:hypothetical protein
VNLLRKLAVRAYWNVSFPVKQRHENGQRYFQR